MVRINIQLKTLRPKATEIHGTTFDRTTVTRAMCEFQDSSFPGAPKLMPQHTASGVFDSLSASVTVAPDCPPRGKLRATYGGGHGARRRRTLGRREVS